MIEDLNNQNLLKDTSELFSVSLKRSLDLAKPNFKGDSSMKVIILNGVAGAGKGVFVKMLNKLGNSVNEYSSIDWVKEKAGLIGWDGKKDARGRQLLNDIKQAVIAYDDIPLKKVVYHLEASSFFDYFCTDIREPSEIEKLKRICEIKNWPCFSVLIRNHTAEKQLVKDGITNSADNKTVDTTYDFVIPNNGTLSALRTKVKSFISEINSPDCETTVKNKTPLTKDNIDSDLYQKVIADHGAELPVPDLDKDSTMLLIHSLALCGEAGEIANIIKKIVWYRKGVITPHERNNISDEIGDTLYHIAQLSTMLKQDLSDVMINSAGKCIERGADGFI